MKMWLTIYFLAFSVSTCFSCEYSRTPGLFLHGFTSNVATDNFVAETGEDTDPNYDDSSSVTFTNNFKIYSGTNFNTAEIHDSGMILLYASGSRPGAPTTEYSGTSPFALQNQAFATALWFEDSGAYSYQFKYKHLLATDMVESGTDIGPSKCELQRLQNIVGDCSENGYRKNTPEIVEALIVTWEIARNADNYYFQTVLAVNADGDTYVVYLYSDPTDLPSGVDFTTGYLTGSSNTVGKVNAGVCPYQVDSLPANIHLQSNCRCGDWNKGIYIFKTSAGDECGKTETNFKTECSKDVVIDNTQNLNMACRPARNLQDTCLELVYCKATKDGNEVTIKVLNSPFQSNTAITFVDYVNANNIIESTASYCSKSLAQEVGTDVYGVTLTLTDDDASTCKWSVSADEITFSARLYDITESEIDKAGSIYIKATCDILPNEISVTVEHGSITEYDIPTVSGRRIEMFLNKEKYYKYGNDDTRIPANAVVTLGQDIYLAIGYDWGDRIVTDKIEPYGIYGTDCWVSNNELFDSTGNNRVLQLTDETTGCIKAGLSSDKAFYIPESFKMAMTDMYGGVSHVIDDDKTTFNYVITTAKFDAAKWIVGGSSKIYFKCTVKPCYNQAFMLDSKCWDTCGNARVDYARKKRTANETTEDRYPDITVQTSVTFVKPEAVSNKDSTEPEVECISNVVAYSTILALTVLLLVAMGVTLMMFVRLHARQKKRT